VRCSRFPRRAAIAESLTHAPSPTEVSSRSVRSVRMGSAAHRPDAIQPAFNALLGVVDDVFSVDQAAVERAQQIVLGHKGLSARDGVRIAVMQIQS